MTLFVDFETRSPVNIRGAGGHRYAANPETEVLLMGWAFDDDTVQVWDATQGESRSDSVDKHIRGGGKVVAHNAQFERLIFNRVLGYDLPSEQFICTAQLARACNLPSKLDLLAWVMLGERKQDDGKALIHRFCVPQGDGTYIPPEGEKWERMKSYCQQDVELERRLYHKLPAWSGATARDYQVSEWINDRGIRIDIPLAEAAVKREELLQAQLHARLGVVTGGALKTPRGVGVTNWVYGRVSESSQAAMLTEAGKPSLTAGVRKELLTHDMDDATREVITICDAASNSSVAKFRKALMRHVDGRLYGSFILDGGSTTGRYSAVGVQPQNLPSVSAADPTHTRSEILAGRGTLTDLKSMVRAMLIPSSGKTFVCPDLAQIEGRVLPWLSDSAGGRARLEIYADPQRDIYCETASAILGRRVTKDDGELRQTYGKIPELALGFGGGKGAILRTANARGVKMPEKQALAIVRSWRAANPWIVNFWKQLNSALRSAYFSPGGVFRAGRVSYRRVPGTMTVQCSLPDGSLLHYHQVREDLDDLVGMHTRSQPKAGGSEWPTVRLWHGILAENITQATAARVQRRILARLYVEGFDVVGHSHDEVLVEVPSDDVEEYTREIEAIVTNRPKWALDLPLHSESWHGQRYGK